MKVKKFSAVIPAAASTASQLVAPHAPPTAVVEERPAPRVNPPAVILEFVVSARRGEVVVVPLKSQPARTPESERNVVVLSLAFVLAAVSVPMRNPAVAPAATRTETVVSATVPVEGTKFTEELKVVPSVETSKPVGAVTTKSATRSIPETVKVCALDAVPVVEVKVVRVVAVRVMVGVAATVPVTAKV